jgi:hypothetical protein
MHPRAFGLWGPHREVHLESGCQEVFMRVHSAFSVIRAVAAATALFASTGSVLADDLGVLLSENNKGVSQDVLAGQRGGSEGGPSGVVTHNIAITGDNNSQNMSSVSGSTGLFNVLQNNGNNVVMQSQITINADLH